MIPACLTEDYPVYPYNSWYIVLDVKIAQWTIHLVFVATTPIPGIESDCMWMGLGVGNVFSGFPGHLHHHGSPVVIVYANNWIFFLNSKTCLLISVRWIKFSSYNTYCIKKGTNALYVRHKKKIRKTTCLYYIRWISKVIQERFVCSIYFPFLYSTYPISFATPIF